MIELLKFLIIFCVVAYVIFLVVNWLPLPAPIKQAAIVILAALALILFLDRAWPLLAGGHF